jgi:hypothetical protein
MGGVSSPSVSVSSPLPLTGLLSAAGRAERLKIQTVARALSFSGKWTFFGVCGSERERRCIFGAGRGINMAGDEEDDLREDLRGFPFERRMGADMPLES